MPEVLRPEVVKFRAFEESECNSSRVILRWPVGPEDVCLTATEVQVWSARLEPHAEQVQCCWEVLSCDERRRAERFHFQSDWLHFVVARGVLRILLGRYLGMPGSELRLRYGKFGKPALDERHDSDLQFNLAHSGDLAVYAFTRLRNLGVDVESEQVHLLNPGVPECSFTVAEQYALAALPVASRKLASLTLWTRKEAYFKALGHGLQQAPDSLELSVPPFPQAPLCHSDENGKQTLWSFCDLEPAPNCVGTLCVENAETSLWSWR